MTESTTDMLLENNKRYVAGDKLHQAGFPGTRPIRPARRVAVVACMDARLDVEDMLGLQTGEAHIIRNAGGVITEDAMRSLIISHHLLDTREIMLIHHTRCGMLAFTDELLKAGLEGDRDATAALRQATGRDFRSCERSAATPEQFHAFRGAPEALDAPTAERSRQRLAWDVRRSMSRVMSHPWLPIAGADAVSVRGFIYDVDTGKLSEVDYPGAMGPAG